MPTNNNENTQHNVNNSRVIVNVSTSSLHEHHKRKSHKAQEAKEAAVARPAPTQVGVHNVYYPQQSLITNTPHVPIPSYFQSALTNRDLALHNLNAAAMAEDEHRNMRNAYVYGDIPGGVGVPPEVHPEEDAMPRPRDDDSVDMPDVHDEPEPFHGEAHDDGEEINAAEEIQRPHADHVPFEPFEEHRVRRRTLDDDENEMHRDERELQNLEDRFRGAERRTQGRQLAAQNIRNLASRYGVPLRDENGVLKEIHQLAYDIRSHFRSR